MHTTAPTTSTSLTPKQRARVRALERELAAVLPVAQRAQHRAHFKASGLHLDHLAEEDREIVRALVKSSASPWTERVKRLQARLDAARRGEEPRPRRKAPKLRLVELPKVEHGSLLAVADGLRRAESRARARCRDRRAMVDLVQRVEQHPKAFACPESSRAGYQARAEQIAVQVEEDRREAEQHRATLRAELCAAQPANDGGTTTKRHAGACSAVLAKVRGGLAL